MKALIIEDEALIARKLQSKIENIANDIKIIAVLPSLKTAKNWFMQNAEPDLIFMDIQLTNQQLIQCLFYLFLFHFYLYFFF